jgi:hypothetical protein
MPDARKHVTKMLTNSPILMKVVASNMAQKDKTMCDFITKHVYTGKGFEGCEVTVRGGKKNYKGNSYKGHHGSVVGSFLAAQKAPNKNSRDWESLEMQVQKILQGVKVKSV